MARDEDIFRKLKKQKPLAKRKDLQPLSSQDFGVRNERSMPQVRRVAPKAAGPGVVSSKAKADRRGAALAGRYNSARQKTAAEPGLSLFGESAPPAKPVRQAAPQKPRPKAQAETLRFTEPAARKPETASRGYGRPEPPSPSGWDEALSGRQEAASAGAQAFRHELKFYITYHDYVLLRNTIKALVSLDRNAGADGNYHIRSVYFDDVNETALSEKMAGVENRCKYRIRFYNYDDSVIRFEKKIKTGAYISKVSIALTRDECDGLLAGDSSVLEGRSEPLASEICMQMKTNFLRPRVIVDYWREAYVAPLENVRITFDKDIKGGLWLNDVFSPLSPTMPMLDEGMLVLEVKFDRYLPEPIKAILTNVNTAQRSAISKYVICRKFD